MFNVSIRKGEIALNLVWNKILNVLVYAYTLTFYDSKWYVML